MARIRSKDTKPEMAVRRIAHGMGYRFRVHRNDLPGRPDVVFPSRRAVIFVHGCFWHSHPDPNCKDAVAPKTRTDYWLPKLARNKARDAINIAALETAGWRVMTIWECEIRDREAIMAALRKFLGEPGARRP